MVKIVCLSVGLAIGLVMLAEVIFERSYDNFLPGLKETYRVEERYKQKDTDWREHAQTPGAIGPGLQRYCPVTKGMIRPAATSMPVTAIFLVLLFCLICLLLFCSYCKGAFSFPILPPLTPPREFWFRILVSKEKVMLSSSLTLFNASRIIRSRSSG